MSTVMRVTANGQISLPAATRRKWNTDRVILLETIDGILVRPYDPDAPRRLMGKYRDVVGPSSDEIRAQERREEALREATRDHA